MVQEKESKELSDIQSLIDEIPFAKFLSIHIRQRESQLTTVMPFAPTIIGNTQLPAIHGGILGSLLEITASIQLKFESQLAHLPKNIDFSTAYLRSGKPKTTYGQATVIRCGRRVAYLNAKLWQDSPEYPIASGHGHFLLIQN